MAVTNGTHGHFKANPSLVVTADHQIRMEEAPIHEPGPGEVLLHIKVTGICGSDVHFWKHGRIGDLTIDGDCILGHEPAGVVLKKGADVTHLEPGVPCGHCFLCTGGRPNLCQDVAFAGVYPYHGTIQRYKVHPAKFAHRLPDNVTFDSAALLEPLSVAMHALRITPITMGTPVAVFGAGPIGLLTMASAAKVRDLFERKGWESSAGRTEYDMPNVVLECTGIESSIATAAFTVRRGGSINVVGVSSRPSINNIPFMHMSLAEIQLRFINRYHDTWPAALRALEGGLIDPTKVDGLVTHRFKLEDAIDAMNLVAGITKPAPGERVVKVQIVDELEVEIP
uniref:Alcohol dehydrogenase-like N-terminal domain-containing protein n=1 Tax=Bionectria ochroleuca TaxID=29856 RepID=A0A0B7KBI3_BIOOC